MSQSNNTVRDQFIRVSGEVGGLRYASRRKQVQERCYKLSVRSALDRMTKWLVQMMRTKWFAVVLSVCTFLDTFLLVFPIDPLLITATMMRPKYWLLVALTVAAGNILSVFVFSFLVFNHLEWLTEWMVSNFSAETVAETQAFSQKYGTWAAFLGAMTPIPFQLFLLAGATTKMNSTLLVASVAGGRLLKYIITCGLASYAPDLLKKLFKFRI